MLEKLVKLKARVLAEDHPRRLGSEHTLAGAYIANGRYRDAVEILEKVVAISTRVLDEDHPDQLASQHMLAMAYRSN